MAIGHSLPFRCLAARLSPGVGKGAPSRPAFFSQIWLGRWTVGDNGQQKQAPAFSQAFLRQGSWLEHQLRTRQQRGQKSSRISDRSSSKKASPPPFQLLLNIGIHRGRACEFVCQRWVEWARRAWRLSIFVQLWLFRQSGAKVPSPDASRLAMLLSANFPRAGNTHLRG